MKKLINLLFIAVTATSIQSCTTVDSADIGLKVDQFASDSKGEPIVIPVQGFIFYNPFITDIHVWEGYVQHKVWDLDDQADIQITTKDGGRFSLDIGFNYQVNRHEAANLFKKYRLDLDQLIDTRLRNIVRQSLTDVGNTYRSDSLLQYRAQYEANVSKILTERLNKEGFMTTAFTVLDMRAPESYSKAIEAKIQIQQTTLQAQANLAKVRAEADSKVAAAKGEADAMLVKAKAQAEAQRLQEQTLSPAYLRKIWIEQWDGKLPTMMTGENANLLINK